MEKTYISLISLFVCIIAGYYCNKTKIFNDAFNMSISVFVVKIAFPASILVSMQQEFSIEVLKNTIIILVATTIIHLASIALGILYCKVFNVDKKEAGVLAFALTFPNISFVGIPLITSMYGESAVFYVSIANVMFNILAFTLGIKLITYGYDLYDEISFDTEGLLKNIPIIATVVGFTFFVLEIKLPSVIMEPVTLLSTLTTPLAMLLTGSILAEVNIKNSFKNIHFLIVTLLRLLILPVVFYGFLGIFIDNRFIVNIISLLMGMPVASITVILAKSHDANVKSASQIIFLTTLFCFITIPLISFVLTK